MCCLRLEMKGCRVYVLYSCIQGHSVPQHSSQFWFGKILQTLMGFLSSSVRLSHGNQNLKLSAFLLHANDLASLYDCAWFYTECDHGNEHEVVVTCFRIVRHKDWLLVHRCPRVWEGPFRQIVCCPSFYRKIQNLECLHCQEVQKLCEFHIVKSSVMWRIHKSHIIMLLLLWGFWFTPFLLPLLTFYATYLHILTN